MKWCPGFEVATQTDTVRLSLGQSKVEKSGIISNLRFNSRPCCLLAHGRLLCCWMKQLRRGGRQVINMLDINTEPDLSKSTDTGERI